MEGLMEVGLVWIRASAPYVFTSLALLAGLLIYFYAPYWGVRKVPGPPTTPLLGHLPLLTKYGPDVFKVLAKKYGPIYRFHMGRQPLIIIAEPELCREVGIRKFKDVGNRSIPSPISASPLHQKGLFFTRGSRWSTMRNTLVSLYQPSHLSTLIPTMQSYIQLATQNLSSSTTLEQHTIVSHLFLKMATDIIGQAAFGVDFGLSKDLSTPTPATATNNDDDDNDDQVSGFIKQHIYSTTSLKMDLSGSLSIILGLLLPLLQEPLRQLLRWIPGTADRKIDQTNKDLSRRLDEIVAKRIKERDRGSKDLLSAILGVRESMSKDIFTSDYVSAITYEHLLAGSATTSFTLSSILYLVSGHPEVEKKLVEEIDGFGEHDLMPTADDLQNKFSYLDQVIKESMRFYTVSPLVARETSRQVEIGGYTLPKGTWVWLALGVLAKDPKHFPEPDKFRPERFDLSCDEEKKRHPYAHIPFGIGPRACIGQRFALQELKLALIHLYRKYVFRHSPKMESPLELEYGIILNFKYGVKLLVVNRDG